MPPTPTENAIYEHRSALAPNCGPDEDIVLTGISGRFPSSDNIEEFWIQLMNGIELSSCDESRWPYQYFGLPPKMGKMKSIDRFDADFFKLSPFDADMLDPQIRLLFETTYEAICDSGYCPDDLKGTRTAMSNGLCYDNTSKSVTNDLRKEVIKKTYGVSEVSHFFDFRAPAFNIDTACASSFSGLNEGLLLMRYGIADALLSCGVALHLTPAISKGFAEMRMISPDGKSKCLDAAVDGYCRSEAVVSLFFQRRKHARRIYATLLCCNTNSDGFKPESITFPGFETQKNLLMESISNAGIHALDIDYIEAHVTGTAAGDPVESNAILEAYRGKSEKPIMFGCLKSNMGHSESASANCSIAKVAMIFQKHCIPPNINYKNANPNIDGLMTKRIIPVLEPTKFENAVIPVNSFGFGGVNVHAIFRANEKVATEESYKIVENMPRLVHVCSRLEDGVSSTFNWIQSNRKDITKDFLYLLNNISKTELESGMFTRGFAIFDEHKILKQKIGKNESRRPLWFIFSALGCQWRGMAKDLMVFKPFAKSINNSARILKSVNINLVNLIFDDDSDLENDIINANVSIVCMQIALLDILTFLGLKPNGIIGHSLGEVPAAYADGCISAEQAVWIAYYMAKTALDVQKGNALMAAIGLGWDDALRKCPSGVYPACHNSDDGVTISGDVDEVKAFINKLEEEGVFAKEVQSCNIAYHCPLVKDAFKLMVENLSKFLLNPKKRSNRWIVTSGNNENTSLADPKFFANNVVSPVMFRNALNYIPRDACVVEVGPHALLLPIVRRALQLKQSCVAIMRRDSKQNISDILSAIGEIYINGWNPEIENLYPRIDYPVSRETASISHLIKWDHTRLTKFCKFPEYFDVCKTIRGRRIDVMDRNFKFLEGHCVDGRNLFPATGYLYIVWSTYAWKYGHEQINNFSIEFRNVTFHRATIIPKQGVIHFGLNLCEDTHEFIVTEGDSTCVTGLACIPKDNLPNYDHLIKKCTNNCVDLKQEDIYKELRIRGYDYGPTFQGLVEAKSDGCKGKVKWNGQFVSFTDSMFHLSALAANNRYLNVPTFIEYLRCDSDILFTSGEKEGVLDVYFDKEVNIGISKGVIFKGLRANPVPRRIDQQVPTLEHCSFVPYFSSCRTSKQNVTEIDRFCKLCSTLLSKLHTKQYTMTDNEINAEFEEESGFLNKLRDSVSKEKNFDEFIDSISREDRNCWILNTNFRDVVETQIRFVVDNVASKQHRVVEYNKTTERLETIVQWFLTTYISKSEEYLLYPTSSTDGMQFPSTVKNIDFIIYKDLSTELITNGNLLESEQRLNDFVKSTYNALKTGGYFLVYFRRELTNFEKELLQLQGVEYQTHENKHVIEKIIQNSDFTIVSEKSDDFSMICLVLKKKEPIPQDPIIIKTDPLDYNWIDLLKTELKKNRLNRIWLVSESKNSGLHGFTRSMKKEYGPRRIRCLVSDDFDGTIPLEIQEKDWILNVQKCNVHGTVLHQGIDINETLVDCKHAYLDIKTKGDLSSFRWYVAPHKHWPSLLPHERKPGDYMAYIYYSALNFKDVMVATGRIPLSAYPEGSEDRSSVGLEFSGIDETGRRICGFRNNYSIATTLMLGKDDFVFTVPDFWTLEEAATVPVVYATVYFALILRGGLQPGEKVLIHAGSGGVGQAAISVCLHMGCEVFTSVGSEEKVNFLKKRFPQLEDRNFVNSRSLKFEEHILKETNGTGVDMILNSLAEEKFRAGLNCLADYGRFVEIGKFDIVQNSKFDTFKLDHNKTLQVVCVAHLMHEYLTEENPNGLRKIKQIKYLFQRGLQNGEVTPLQRCLFDYQDLEKAFRFMASGKHIGKVVLRIREESISLQDAKLMSIKCVPQTFFHPSYVYIVLGGLGGIGLELCYWLFKRGAQKIVLTSRSGVSNNYQKYILQCLSDKGVKVVVSTNTAATYELVYSLITESMKMGPIGGIFNLAMVLMDLSLENLSIETFSEACRPKVHSTIFLDQVTRKLCPDLEYFVCFSSAASGRGNVGQSNYAFANNVMESVCQKRRDDNLHGLAVQWGAIGDVGFVAVTLKYSNAAIMGTLQQRVLSLFNTMDHLLSAPYAVCSSIVFADNKHGSNQFKGDLLKIVCHILGFTDIASLDENMTIGELGMDSLMAVEIKQGLERDYNTVLTTQEIRELTVKDIRKISKKRVGDSEDNSSEIVQTQSYDSLVLPIHLYTRLDNNEQGIPIFFFPPIEGDFSLLTPLCKYISRPAIGINWVEEVDNFETVEQVAAYYVKKLREDHPLPEYDIVSYSFGALVAFEVCIQLQRIDSRLVKRLILMDGSTDYLKASTAKLIQRSNVTEEIDAFRESLIFFVSLFYDFEFVEKLKAEIYSVKTKSELVNHVSDLIRMLSGTQCSPHLLTKAAERYYNKLRLVNNYRVDKKLKGHVYLLCSTKPLPISPDLISSEINNEFKKMIDGNCEVIPTEGDHKSFLTSNYEEIGNFIESKLYFILQ